MTLTATTLRRLGLLAMLGGVIGILYFPFHASAYFATADGVESLDAPWVEAWNTPFRAAVGPLLTFSDADAVYLTWGKVMVFAIAAHLCGVVALHAWQKHAGGKLLRAAYPLLVVAMGLTGTAALILNWVPGGLIDAVFVGLALPGLLLMLVAYPLYGAATLKARVLPRGLAWLLTLAGPGLVPIVILVGHLGGGMLLMHVTWILVGRAIRQRVPAERAAAAVAPA